MAEFTEIGRHCAAQNCNQQDFLPFKCDCCEGTFCLPHRSYSAHACASSGTKDFRALVCPLCKKTVRFADSEDPDEQWDLHTRTDCRPGDYNKKPPKKRCSAPSCREVLGPTNTQQCARCGKETCLSHRYPDSHSCTGAGSSRGNARSSAAAAAARRMEAQRPMSLREKAAQKRAAASNNTARASADRRRRATPVAQEVGGGARGQGEQCPQCEASFRDVGSLVAHVEAFHSEKRGPRGSGVGSGGGGGTSGERCPICSSEFGDVALLVSHVEAMHPDGAGAGPGAASTCSVS